MRTPVLVPYTSLKQKHWTISPLGRRKKKAEVTCRSFMSRRRSINHRWDVDCTEMSNEMMNKKINTVESLEHKSPFLVLTCGPLSLHPACPTIPPSATLETSLRLWGQISISDSSQFNELKQITKVDFFLKKKKQVVPSIWIYYRGTF